MSVASATGHSRLTEREIDAIHTWARRLPWWVFLLVHRWLPDYTTGRRA